MRVRGRLFGLIVAGLVLALLAASLGIRLYGRHRLTTVRAEYARRGIPLERAAYRPPDMPPLENAATWLVAGANAIVLTRETRETLARGLERHGTDEGWRRVEAIVRDNEGALAILHRANALPKCIFNGEYGQGTELNTSKMWQAATLLHVDARLGLRRHDVDRALASLTALGRMNEALLTQSVWYWGTFAEQQTLDVLAHVVRSDDPWLADVPRLETLLRLMPSTDRMAHLKTALGYQAMDWSTTTRDLITKPIFRGGDEPANAVESAIAVTFTDLTKAVTLEQILRALDIAADPSISHPEDEEAQHRPPPSPLRIPSRIADMYAPGPRIGVYLRYALQYRALVRAALELRILGLKQGSYPAERPSLAALDAAARDGEAVRYEPQADGSLRLGAPGFARRDIVLPALAKRSAR